MDALAQLLPILLIVLVFWLLLIRPQSKRQKALASLQRGLVPGNEVLLTSGIFGVVEEVRDDRLLLRVADGVTMQVVRGAVANVVPEPEPEDEPEPETEPGVEPDLEHEPRPDRDDDGEPTRGA